MKKLRKLRIWLTVGAMLCLLAVSAMATWGVNNDFSDGLLLIMKLVGGAGVVFLLCNAAVALYQLSLGKKSDK